MIIKKIRSLLLKNIILNACSTNQGYTVVTVANLPNLEKICKFELVLLAKCLM